MPVEACQPDLFGQSSTTTQTAKPLNTGRLLFALASLAKAFPHYQPEIAACIESVRVKRVLRAIQRGAATRWEIVQITKIPESTVHVYLHILMDQGKIRRTEGETPNRPAHSRGGTKPEFCYFPA